MCCVARWRMTGWAGGGGELEHPKRPPVACWCLPWCLFGRSGTCGPGVIGTQSQGGRLAGGGARSLRADERDSAEFAAPTFKTKIAYLKCIKKRGDSSTAPSDVVSSNSTSSPDVAHFNRSPPPPKTHSFERFSFWHRLVLGVCQTRRMRNNMGRMLLLGVRTPARAEASSPCPRRLAPLGTGPPSAGGP